MVPVWITFSDLFTSIQHQIAWKWYNIQLYLLIYYGRPIESRIWSIEWRHFQWPWTTPTPSFKVTPFFDAEHIINGMTYRHSFNEILIETYTRPTQQCYFEWPWVTLSDLAKYSMTWSGAQSLCDSWASCLPFRLSTVQDITRLATLITFKKKLKICLFSEHLCWQYCILSSHFWCTLHSLCMCKHLVMYAVLYV